MSGPVREPQLVGAAAFRWLDEAIRILELRRYRRMLGSARLPLLYSAVIFVIAGFLIPFLFGDQGVIARADPAPRLLSWGAGTLLAVTAVAAGTAAYLRTLALWNQERRAGGLSSWLLTRQDRVRVALTPPVMAAMLALGLVAVPSVFGVCMGIATGIRLWQLAAFAGLIPLCALLGAATGSTVFFAASGLLPRWLSTAGLALLLLAVAGLWLRLELREGPVHPGWDRHPGRILQAAAHVSPIGPLYTAASPGWWDHAARRLGIAVPAPSGCLLGGLWLAAATAFLGLLSTRAFLRLAREPDLLDEPPAPPGQEEGGRDHYWPGFANPVLTRDIRTRLRSRDTAEFIFFSSIAVAAGAFVPLLLSARDLSDPLLTAAAAKQVFFWLTMTLVALVTLVAPSLTADIITQERTSGTLEMLIGTSLRPRDILVGRLLGASGLVFLLLSPSAPLFGLCYVFRGADAAGVLLVVLLLVLTTVLTVFIGLAQSAINARGGMARFWAYALTGLFVGFPGGPFWIAAGLAAPDPSTRGVLSGLGSISALVMLFWAFVFVLLWGNASEQLEYSEY